ncbi:hypothetical protein ACFQ2Z_21855, partial [Paenibacillus timonensis]
RRPVFLTRRTCCAELSYGLPPANIYCILFSLKVSKVIRGLYRSIEFKVIKVVKINEYTYEVHVVKKENNEYYPVIPYRVINEKGSWKVDTRSVIVSPKDSTNSKMINPSDIFSENEKYIVQKIAATESSIGLFSDLSYSFGENSTDIYFNGSVYVHTYPKGGSQGDFLIISMYRVDSEYPGPSLTRTVTGSENHSETFTHLYGYHYVRVDIGNTTGNTITGGTYKVEW